MGFRWDAYRIGSLANGLLAAWSAVLAVVWKRHFSGVGLQQPAAAEQHLLDHQ
jgi:hypothetical protein